MLLLSARVVLIVVDRPLCSPRSPVAEVDALLRHREDVRGADAYSPRRRRCRLSGFGDKEEEKQGDGRRRFAFMRLPRPESGPGNADTLWGGLRSPRWPVTCSKHPEHARAEEVS